MIFKAKNGASFNKKSGGVFSLKYGIIGVLILILVICFVLGGFELAFVSFFLMFAIFQFVHTWNRQSYVISFKDFIAPVLNFLVGIIMLLGVLLLAKV